MARRPRSSRCGEEPAARLFFSPEDAPMLQVRNCKVSEVRIETLSVDVDADQFVSSLDLDEAKELISAVLGRHGVKAFADVCEDVIDEFHTCDTDE
jgi:hypothetical protein